MLTPEQRRVRAAIVSRHKAELARIEAAREGLRAIGADEYIRRAVLAAPPLSEEQRLRLASLLTLSGPWKAARADLARTRK